MQSKLKMLTLIGLAICLVAGIACGGGEEVGEDTRAADLEALQAKKAALDEMRAELMDLRAAPVEPEATDEGAPAEDAEAEAAEGEEAMEVVDPAAQLKNLEADVFQMSDELMNDVVNFINSDPPLEGEPLNDFQAAAFQIKSAEDALVAEEYISAGGDYRRAIRIYQDALLVDPDNADLQAGLERAESLRYMTEERFTQLEKGMTQDDVRAVIGQVNLRNVREYEDKEVISWFYTKENGGAAGVHFQKGNDGWRLYESDFDAVKPPEEREAE